MVTMCARSERRKILFFSLLLSLTVQEIISIKRTLKKYKDLSYILSFELWVQILYKVEAQCPIYFQKDYIGLGFFYTMGIPRQK